MTTDTNQEAPMQITAARRPSVNGAIGQPGGSAGSRLWRTRPQRAWPRASSGGLLARAAVLGLAGVIVVFAVHGRQWRWTGFGGKQLWDWLHLMLFPVVVVLLPEWVRKGEPFGPRERGIAVMVLIGFVVLLIGGYDWGWTWTGFTGNSFHDWLALMIAPFLLPLSCRLLHAYHTSGRAAGVGRG
jgi:hypothetical protein